MNFIHLNTLPQILEAIPSRSPADRRDRAACTVLAHTDLLVQELCGLVVAQVAFDGLGLVIRSTLKVPPRPGVCSRGREIPLNAQAVSALQEILNYNVQRGYSVAPAAPLMASRTGHFVRARDYQQLLQRCLKLSA